MFIPINFGDRVAENEAESLNAYFVETHAWKELYEGKKDVVFGSKGAGKSALYTLLLQKEGELLSSRNTFLLSAEKPQGQTVFSDISSTPPTSEKEFVYLWKIYFCQLIVDYLQKNNQCKGKANEVKERLVEAGLIQETNNLKRLLNGAASFAKKLASIESLEGGGSLVEATVSGRITFKTPSFEESQKGLVSVDELLGFLDEHLQSISMSCWLLCDRLDVAFDESLELEKNALRALFKVYRDVEEYQQIALKVFLRDDIWARITKEGFREASHITRTTTISWDSKNLLNLIIRRALCDSDLVKHFNVDTSEIMNDHNQQEKFYYEIFPKQVDLGEKKSETFEWIKSRIRDGLMNTPPRELIHYYNEIVTQEQREQEIGNDKVEEPNIVSRAAIKSATIEVSKVRTEQTLFAEFPELKEKIMCFENKKAEHNLSTLQEVWGEDEEASRLIANKLADIGFFENRPARNERIFKIPFIYRPYLNITQGKAY